MACDGQALERRNALARGSRLVGNVLPAACGGRWRAPAASPAGPRRVVAQWTWLSASSLRSALCGLPCLRKILQLLPGRDIPASRAGARRRRRRRHWPRWRRSRAVSPLQPAAQEAGHEAVARAQHVVDLDRESPGRQCRLPGGRGSRRDRPRSPWGRASDDGGRRHGADGSQRGDRVGRAAGDVDLFFRADDQVAVRQDRLAAARSPCRT